MTRILGLMLSIIGLFLSQSCTPSTSQPQSPTAPIAVTWELLKNEEQNGTITHQALFSIKNTSSEDLNDQWALYWNQSPREILDYGPKDQIELRRVNGDFYELKTINGFSLKANETLEVSVLGEVFLTKETDGPLGLYMVDQASQEKFLVEDYEIIEFEKPGQIHRTSGDKVPIPSAASIYEGNKDLSQLDRLNSTIPGLLYGRTENQQFQFPQSILLHHHPDFSAEAELLKADLESMFEFKVKTLSEEGAGAHIFLVKDRSYEDPESYELKINERSLAITSNTKAGIYYGSQTLLQLIKGEANTQYLNTGIIFDRPAYKYRGLHVDVSRNFQQKETLLKLIDAMGRYKLNKLQLYLGEDEGWRLEIDALPELIEVGSKRGHTLDEKSHLQPAYGSGPFVDGKGTYGSGYYSKAEYTEIIQYAHARNVQVIPTFNLPGHARAAIVSMEARYERLMAEGKEEEALAYRLRDPGDESVYKSAQYYNDNVVDVCSEGPYRFAETVIDEIIKIYADANVPLDMIHVGGDEIPANSWSQSSRCDEVRNANPEISSSRNLHAYFFQRLNQMMLDKGLKSGVWEESVMVYNDDGSWYPNPDFVGKDVYPYVWNNLWGNADLGYRLANADYPVILCNVTNLYFDMAYSKDPREPGLYWGGYVNTKDAYTFAPEDLFYSTVADNMGNPLDYGKDFEGMESLAATKKTNIAGLQAELFAETVKGEEMLEYMIFPKLLGYADRAWLGQPSWMVETDLEERAKKLDESWNKFANTLGQRELHRLEKLNGGYHFRLPPPGIKMEEKVHMNSAFPGLEIRYTTDGSEPTAQSTLYTEPFTSDAKVITAKTFTATRSSLSSSLNLNLTVSR